MWIIVIRGLEIIATGMLLLIFAPLMLCIAIAIFLESGSPVSYKSRRIGKKGRVFSLFYFRTMHPGSGTSESRLTHVGRFLRNYSLDHLPQTLNVLRGEMRIVGSRPMTPEETDLQNEDYQDVLQVKPGMLSPAILSLGRAYNASDFATKARLDAQYLRQRSLWKDFNLSLATLRAFFSSRGNIKKHGKNHREHD